MGTNYYWSEEASCPGCGRKSEGLHIGKSSGGWCFSLHVIPEDGINSLDDWIARFNRPGSTITDEYGRTVTPDEMLDIIRNRSWRERAPNSPPPGYLSMSHFYERNDAEPGPNGLLRHRIDGYGHCIAHGDGTWDYITGKFC